MIYQKSFYYSQSDVGNPSAIAALRTVGIPGYSFRIVPGKAYLPVNTSISTYVDLADCTSAASRVNAVDSTSAPWMWGQFPLLAHVVDRDGRQYEFYVYDSESLRIPQGFRNIQIKPLSYSAWGYWTILIGTEPTDAFIANPQFTNNVFQFRIQQNYNDATGNNPQLRALFGVPLRNATGFRVTAFNGETASSNKILTGTVRYWIHQNDAENIIASNSWTVGTISYDLSAYASISYGVTLPDEITSVGKGEFFPEIVSGTYNGGGTYIYAFVQVQYGRPK